MRKLIFVIIIVFICAAAILAVVSLYGSGNGASISSALYINEIMASNKQAVPDEYGDFPDWVELYNASDSDIDLSNYGLSNSKKQTAKWLFPNGSVIKAKSYLVIYCSGNSNSGRYYASFRISADDALVLTNPTGQFTDSLQLTAVAKNASLGRDENGNWVELLHPTPGFPNTEAGLLAYRESLMSSSSDNGIRINELMASNSLTYPGSYNDYPDWVELYNTTNAAVDISGYGLSDDIGQPRKWIFPEGTLIEPNGYLIICCSSRDGLFNGELHTSFNLRAYGEDIVFSAPNGEIIDSTTYSSLDSDISLARSVDGTGEFVQAQNPSPGSANN